MKEQSTHSVPGLLKQKSVITCLALLIISASVMAGAFFFSLQHASVTNNRVHTVGELRMLSQQIAGYADEAADGKEEAFSFLRDRTRQYDQHLQQLEDSPSATIPFLNKHVHPANLQIESINAAWSELKVEIEQILANENIVLSLHEVTTTLNEAVPQLQLEYNEVLDILLENNASASQIAFVQRQPWLAERVINSLARILAAEEDSIIAADSFSRDTQLFGRVLNGMLQGDAALEITQVINPEVVERLDEIAYIYSFFSDSVEEVLDNSPELFLVRNSAETIFTDSQQLLQQTSILANTFFNLSQQRQWLEVTGITASLTALLAMFLITMSMARDRKTKQLVVSQPEESLSENTANLLDELSVLTSQNHHENHTEASDSVLISIERLKTIINTIRQTALAVDDASQAARSATETLTHNAAHQSTEISAVSESVNHVVETIHEVSDNASNSASVSDRAVNIASSGGLVVQSAIEGMTSIREHIQNTSQRIRHLGESSQEINDIIQQINDIADQTSILSLNAAIQASMAGDAGRGFAVVADEVQRLSERVSRATRQAGGLISTIKADTLEAVSSMEQTVTEVSHGVRLAQDAGIALEEIEQISRELATLIRGIAETTRGQAQTTAQITTRMNTIRDMTFQASTGSETAAQSINNLTQMALDMRQSVADFKLPETES